MSDLTIGKGSCLCGAVHVSAKTMTKKAGACHCTMCQKWAGGPLIMVDCGSDVSFQDEENVAVFDSSEWAERGFCKKCGSHLFYRLKERHQYFMPVGIFDGSEQFILDHQIFIEQKPEYYCFANETQNMTGAEVFAMFAPATES
jgi:hypothetical protein